VHLQTRKKVLPFMPYASEREIKKDFNQHVSELRRISVLKTANLERTLEKTIGRHDERVSAKLSKCRWQ
jgi:hypothetical protein